MNIKGIHLFTIFGFKVKIDLSWLILGIIITWSLARGFFPHYYPDLTSTTYWIMGLGGALGIFISIIFHELSHSLVAKRFGLPMGGITLFIFGGVAHMTEEPESPKVEFLMAIAGPISSIIFGGVLYGLYMAGDAYGVPVTITGIFKYLSYLNVILAAFNLVPAFPLDGGRLLRSALWKWGGNLRRATFYASKAGSVFGITLIVIGIISVITGNLIGGVWYFLIGMFLRSAANNSYQQLIIRQSLEGYTVRRFMNPNPVSVSPDTSVSELVDKYIYQYHHKMYPVVDRENLLGCVTLKQVKDVPGEERSSKTVKDLYAGCSDDNTIEAKEDAMKALTIMNRTKQSRLLVVDGGGLAGVISLKDIMELLSVKIDLEG